MRVGLSDVYAHAGAILVALGAYLIFPAAGAIVLGALMIYFAHRM
jgi:hypothetical protein